MKASLLAAAVCTALVLSSCSAPAAQNGIYSLDGDLVKDITPLDERSVELFAEKLTSVRETYLTENNRVFYAVIPDKAQYANETVPRIDLEAVCSSLDSALPDWTRIDLSSALSADSYYRTDGHWRQEELQSVVNALGAAMDFSADLSAFEENRYEHFLGTYAGDARNPQPETLVWLTNSDTQAAVVDNYQTPDVKTVYDTDKLASDIPYDVFLSGATPVVTISNPNASTDRELVIFRDSFSSSLAPLLCGEYTKITLLDLRYMATALIPQFVTFGDQDVLFLYSLEVVNNSAMLR